MKYRVVLEDVGDYPSGKSPDPSNTGIISLEFALEHHGGYSFNMELPDGSFVPVSLEEFRGKNPRTTFIVLGVELIDDGPEDRARWEARVVAKRGPIRKTPLK
ncbi:hypothetical protein AB0323_08865 [Arthrobacter sp. NPDC080031]|uniref:hypothetical protein n=1 Tax=Arthrobacter sp. NPDC080031 TaxID=3155918 RepID=UPI00344D6034